MKSRFTNSIEDFLANYELLLRKFPESFVLAIIESAFREFITIGHAAVNISLDSFFLILYAIIIIVVKRRSAKLQSSSVAIRRVDMLFALAFPIIGFISNCFRIVITTLRL